MSTGVSGGTHENKDPDPLLRFIDLARDEENDRWTPRLRLPENIPVDQHGQRAAAEQYWNGASARWQDLQGAVDGGRAVAVLVERSGIVVLDCDVRHRDDRGYIVREPGRASWNTGTTQRGEDDLDRVVSGMGYALPRTWTVRTKSGGVHYYFRCPPGKIRSSGHRRGWAIDVKASENTWVVAPPTGGYSLDSSRRSRDQEASYIAPLPAWLRTWLDNDLPKLEPLGGRVRTKRTEQAQKQYHAALRTVSSGAAHGDSIAEVADQWAFEILNRVRETSYCGGWNSEIYQAACQLDDAGFSHQEIHEQVIDAAQPWDDRERRSAQRTIASALGRVGGEG